MIFLLIAAFACVAFYDVPCLVRQKYKTELILYAVLFLAVFIITVLQLYDITMPSPIKGIAYILKDVLHLSYQ